MRIWRKEVGTESMKAKLFALNLNWQMMNQNGLEFGILESNSVLWESSFLDFIGSMFKLFSIRNDFAIAKLPS